MIKTYTTKMKSFSLLTVLALSASAVAVFAQEGTIILDSPEVFTGCPACDLSFDSNIVSATAANDTFGVVLNFVDALATQEPATVTDVFCENAVLWGTVSESARYSREEIFSYFDYFAREDNEVLSACPQVLQIGEDLYEANVAVNNAGSCLRMSFTIDVKNDCIAHLYSSYFPNDPENLRAADFANGMPWSGDTIQTGTLPAPNYAAGSCSSCDLKVLGDISTSDMEGVDGIMSAWVDGLLSQNSTAIANTHCSDSGSALWGTVSNARRNTFDEIKSYFDWFATSRNFTEEIKSVCSTLVKLSDTVFVEDRELRLGGQCLRMSYTIANEDGTYCIKSLTSSYVPEEPAGLVAADQRNLGGGSSPSEDTPVPPPSGVGNTIPVVMTMVALTMMGILF
jgi:hypothetical protein